MKNEMNIRYFDINDTTWYSICDILSVANSKANTTQTARRIEAALGGNAVRQVRAGTGHYLGSAKALTITNRAGVVNILDRVKTRGLSTSGKQHTQQHILEYIDSLPPAPKTIKAFRNASNRTEM